MAYGRFTRIAALAILATAPAQAQRDEAALKLLDEAIAAHQPAGQLLKAELRFAGERTDPTQGLYALGPFETYPIERTVMIDEAARKSAVRDHSAIAGLPLGRTSINTPETGVMVNDVNKTYAEANAPLPALATLLPHIRLRTVRETATALRLDPSSPQPRVQATLANGRVTTLTFDPATKLLTRVDFPPAATIYGEQRESIAYPSYRRLNGTAVPDGYTQRIENPPQGARNSTVRLVSTRADVPAEAFALPAGLKTADYSWRKPAFAVTTLAPDVHLINNVIDSRDEWSYNVLAVVFEDHVVVAEAPISAEVNERVLAEIEKLAPGKPVRTLVLSHHHSDHIAGIEPYMKRNVPMLVTGEASKLLRRIAEQRGPTFGTPVTEVVSDRKVLKDSRNEVHIYEMGANPHSSQMLVVHLPRQGIIYQVDFVNDGEYPANANTKAFLDWVERRKLRVNTVAGLHGRPVSYPIEVADQG